MTPMSNEEKPARYGRVPITQKRAERDLDDELRLHFELRIEELQRGGMSESEARAEATRRFGDIDDARAYCREQDGVRVRRARRGRWLEEAAQDIRFALRQLRRSRAFATAAVLTMAAGIGMSIAAYSVVHAYLVRPLPYPESERLASVIFGPSRDPFPNAPRMSDVNWLPVDSAFGGSVAWNLDGFTLPDGERPEFVDGAWVTPGYFATLGLRPALGRAFTAQEYVTSAPVALISDALWSRRYGRDSSIIGRTIRAYSTDEPRLDESVTVIGVMPRDNWHISRFTDVLRPLPTGRAPSILRVPPVMSLEEAQATVNRLVRPQLAAPDPAWHLSLVWLQDEYTYRIRPLLLALLGASVFMLLIGGASVAGSLTARAASRKRELTLRAALGASRGRIVRQYLTESAVLSTLAAAGGAVFAKVLLLGVEPSLGARLGVGIPSATGNIDPAPLVFVAAVSIAAAITFVFNVLPALLSARGAGAHADGDRSVTGHSRAPLLRRSLVAGQLALTMMLLVGAGLMIRSVLAIDSAPLGFEPANMLKANLLLPLAHFPDSSSRVQGSLRVIDAVAAQPGVEAAAMVSPHPFRMAGGLPVMAEGGTTHAANAPIAAVFAVAGDYMAVLRLRQIEGRAIGSNDIASTPGVVVISERLAQQMWPDSRAVGRRLRISDGTLRTVIGIVGDTRKSLAVTQIPDVYVPLAQAPRPFVSLLARTAGDPDDMSASLIQTVARVSPVLALAEVESMNAVIERDGQRPRLLAALLGMFAALALSLAVLGLYSSLSYLVSLRNRELAVRMAVGASGKAIARLILGEGLATLAIGIAVGLLASMSMTHLLASQLYGIEQSDALTFVSIILVLLVTTVWAMAVPAARATRVDPAIVLRGE